MPPDDSSSEANATVGAQHKLAAAAMSPEPANLCVLNSTLHSPFKRIPVVLD